MSDKFLSICSKMPKGHRRAGMAFGRDAQVIKASDLSPAQLEAIKTDPNLVVVETDGSVPAPAQDNLAADLTKTQKDKLELEKRLEAALQKIDALETSLKSTTETLSGVEAERDELKKSVAAKAAEPKKGK